MKGLLLSMHVDENIDPSCLQYVADLMGEHGQVDGREFVTEFLRRRASLTTSSLPSREDLTNDSLSPIPSTKTLRDTSLAQYNVPKPSVARLNST